jgi:hypothetical protein
LQGSANPNQPSLLVNDSNLPSVLSGHGANDWLLGGSGANVILGGGGSTTSFDGTSPGSASGMSAGFGLILAQYAFVSQAHFSIAPTTDSFSVIYDGSSPNAPGGEPSMASPVTPSSLQNAQFNALMNYVFGSENEFDFLYSGNQSILSGDRAEFVGPNGQVVTTPD